MFFHSLDSCRTQKSHKFPKTTPLCCVYTQHRREFGGYSSFSAFFHFLAIFGLKWISEIFTIKSIRKSLWICFANSFGLHFVEKHFFPELGFSRSRNWLSFQKPPPSLCCVYTQHSQGGGEGVGLVYFGDFRRFRRFFKFLATLAQSGFPEIPKVENDRDVPMIFDCWNFWKPTYCKNGRKSENRRHRIDIATSYVTYVHLPCSGTEPLDCCQTWKRKTLRLKALRL